jgi:hypothetical protein
LSADQRIWKPAEFGQVSDAATLTTVRMPG